jgi:NADH-quinone oxidoreductase subunit L
LAALLGAGVTAFYMTRMMAMTFFGDSRWQADTHPHESPAVMTVPMVVLAIGSVLGGYLLMFLAHIEEWLEPVTGYQKATSGPSAATLLPATLAVVLGGAAIGWVKYGRRPIPVEAPVNVSVLTRAARADAYGDAFNEAVFMRPGAYLTRLLVWFDTKGVDGTVLGLGAAISGVSAQGRKFQNGLIRSYLLMMVAGSALVLFILYLVRL